MAVTKEIRTREMSWRPDVVDESDIRSALKANQVVYFVLSLLEGLLLFRFAFKLFAANTANDFVEFIYRLSSPLVAPFRGVFATPVQDGSVFESATLLAVVVYALIGYIVARLFFVVTEGTETIDSDLL